MEIRVDIEFMRLPRKWIGGGSGVIREFRFYPFHDHTFLEITGTLRQSDGSSSHTNTMEGRKTKVSVVRLALLLAVCCWPKMGVAQIIWSFSPGYSFKAATNGTNLYGFNPVGLSATPPGYALPVTARSGGTNGAGNIFRLTVFPGSDRSFASDFYTFSGLVNGTNADGAYPQGGMILAADGNYYGVTTAGGAYGLGTLFQLSTNGVLSTLVSFDQSITGTGNGEFPAQNRLVEGGDGSFYGTTPNGGFYWAGCVYRFTPGRIITFPDGKTTFAYFLSILHSFTALNNETNADGAMPLSSLVKGPDGALYGTASVGGTNGAGTIYCITTNYAFTTLHTFSALTGGTNAEGANPRGGLMSASDGALYGCTYQGGTNGGGTMFRITTNGVFTVLVSLSVADGNGANPAASLIQASDGNFYGTTSAGGAGGNGTVFQLSTNGQFSVLHAFTALDPLTGTNADGANPSAPLLQGNDGYLYGVTAGGGNNGAGELFVLTFPPLSSVDPVSPDQDLPLGGSVTFTGSGYGYGPFTYQWQFKGTNISGATNTSLILTNLTLNDYGAYTLNVRNGNPVTAQYTFYLTYSKLDLYPIFDATYPGLLIFGEPGVQYDVYYATNFTDVNWTYLNQFNLTSSPYIYLDPTPATNSQRFYRIMPVIPH